MWTKADRNDYDPQWAGPNPSTCDDLTWFDYTGMCGGCGEDSCHPGQPCGTKVAMDPMYGYMRQLCDRCELRQDQGWWAA